MQNLLLNLSLLLLLTENVTSIGSFQDVLDLIVQTWDKLNVWLPTIGVTSFGLIYKIVKSLITLFKERNRLKTLSIEEKNVEVQKIVESNSEKSQQIQNILLKFLPMFKLLIESTFNEELKEQGTTLYNEVVKSINVIKENTEPIVETVENLGIELKDTGEEMINEIQKVDNNENKDVYFTGE